MLRANDSIEPITREIVLHALTNKRLASTLSEEALNAAIRQEVERGEYEMDCDLLDACVKILEERHAAVSKKQLAQSEQRIRKGLKKAKRKKAAQTQPYHFPTRAVVIASLVVLIILAPVLIKRQPFVVDTTHDEQQYLVIGIGHDEIGIVRAGVSRTVEPKQVKLSNLDEIAQHLGFSVQLPQWLPEGFALESVWLTQTELSDELLVTYCREEAQILVVVTYYESREGLGLSFEQVKSGRQVILTDGDPIYVTSNDQSIWGLYQSKHVDYLIVTRGMDESDLIRIFNSVENESKKM